MEICRGVVSESKASSASKTTAKSRAARRRRIELQRIKPAPESYSGAKRRKMERPWDHENSFENAERVCETENYNSEAVLLADKADICLKYGIASVCGRRRDMEDAVAIRPLFCGSGDKDLSGLHYFGVYDGHGCSHVATKCGERLHELVKEELENKENNCNEWKNTMERSFSRMDKEVSDRNKDNSIGSGSCRCELQYPESDTVGSTAVTAIVTSDKIIVANCGDSRAVLCRSGKAIPLSTDHKPDRPDELTRIQAAGGRVIYWDGPRVLGVLAMSRAIGDNYLKPYVSSEPEVTETNRTEEDDCLILASDGLWDVVSNETACGVARMCLRGVSQPCLGEEREGRSAGVDKACSDASMLLTKLALSRRSSDNVTVVVIDLRRD